MLWAEAAEVTAKLLPRVARAGHFSARPLTASGRWFPTSVPLPTGQTWVSIISCVPEFLYSARNEPNSGRKRGF